MSRLTELIVGGTRSVVSLIEGAKSRTVPVVVVTGWIVAALQRAASAAGGDEILLKPCFPEDLLNAVERLLTYHEARGNTAAPLRSSRSSHPGIDRSNDGPLPTHDSSRSRRRSRLLV